MRNQYTDAPHSVDWRCDACGTPISVYRSRLLTHRRHFCNKVCAAADRSRRQTRPIADRLWARVTKSADCWEWTGSTDRKGYGYIGIGRHQTPAVHQVAWNLACGEPIPDGFGVLHTCDNPPCVRNDDPGIYVIRGIARPRFGHLWIGTNADNIADKVDKGRASRSGAKLTDAQVSEIKRRLNVDRPLLKKLALEFNVSSATISYIASGRRWKHVT